MERYYSEDSNFGVYTFLTQDDIPEFIADYKDPFFASSDDGRDSFQLIKKHMSILSGNMQRLYIGSEYEVEAELNFNAKYKSWQYKPFTVISVTPKTEEQQKRFLMSIVTEQQADTLLSKYPKVVDDVINKRDNVDVSQLKGIGEITWQQIKEKITDNYVISDILVLLQPLGVSFRMIKKLISSEPNPALLKQQLIDNPYIMTKIHGLGFKKVDALALKLNPDVRVSAKRLYAFIKYYLNEMAEGTGHTWTPTDDLYSAVKMEMEECIDLFSVAIENERSNEMVLHFEENKVGLLKNFNYEKTIYSILKEIQEYEFSHKLNAEEGITKAEKALGFQYTHEQREVIKNSIKSNVSIICGFAGTGKTSILKGITTCYSNANVSMACCALSAKASQRIIEATGRPASTIHRLLGFNGKGGFNYCAENRLPQDVIIVDEASMINSQIFCSLLVAVKEGGRVIICGDNRQLPPIGAGNVFSDLLCKETDFSVNKLTKVLRQAEKSGILSDANKVRENKNPVESPELKVVNGELQDMVYMFRDNKESLQNIAVKTFLKAAETDGMDNVAVIIPRRKNCENCTTVINRAVSDALNLPKENQIKVGTEENTMYFRVGSKVMQCENNYDKNVFNGETGYITRIWQDAVSKNIKLEVEYKMNEERKLVEYNRSEVDQLDLAYAMTIHKSQGSGYKTVIVIIDKSHYIMLDSCLLYTAITRAKKRCLMLAEPSAFMKCIKTNKSMDRRTWLKDL